MFRIPFCNQSKMEDAEVHEAPNVGLERLYVFQNAIVCCPLHKLLQNYYNPSNNEKVAQIYASYIRCLDTNSKLLQRSYNFKLGD